MWQIGGELQAIQQGMGRIKGELQAIQQGMGRIRGELQPMQQRYTDVVQERNSFLNEIIRFMPELVQERENNLCKRFEETGSCTLRHCCKMHRWGDSQVHFEDEDEQRVRTVFPPESRTIIRSHYQASQTLSALKIQGRVQVFYWFSRSASF